jgi:hypothetical protein
VEVEVGADGLASAPPSGAADAAPPAGALDALVVMDMVGAAPAIAGPGQFNMSSNGHRLIFPKVTSDAVLPSVEFVS